VQESSQKEGHIFIHKTDLISETISILTDHSFKLSIEQIETQMLCLEEEGKLITEGDNVYLPTLFYAEKGLVTNIIKLLKNKDHIEEFPEAEFFKSIGETEEEFKIDYAPSQKRRLKRH
jgi:exodeoxyribonuclease V alpha subunit